LRAMGRGGSPRAAACGETRIPFANTGCATALDPNRTLGDAANRRSCHARLSLLS
jgi:hypothetical protein